MQRPTTVSLFNIPLEMPDADVSNYISRYGKVVKFYRSKKTFLGKSLFTDTRVYFLELVKPIPKSLNIGGRPVRTVYTGQDQAMADHKAKLEEERNLRREEDARKMAEVVRDKTTQVRTTGEVVHSFLHPEEPSPPVSVQQEMAKEMQGRIIASERHPEFSIFYPAESPENVAKVVPAASGMGMVKPEAIELPTIMAICDQGWHHALPKTKFDAEFTSSKLYALFLYFQFGYASNYRHDPPDVEGEKEKYFPDSYRQWLRLENFDHERIVKYAYDWEERFLGTYITLPV